MLGALPEWWLARYSGGAWRVPERRLVYPGGARCYAGTARAVPAFLPGHDAVVFEEAAGRAAVRQGCEADRDGRALFGGTGAAEAVEVGRAEAGVGRVDQDVRVAQLPGVLDGDAV